jgi:DNA mismatch repair protein MutH
VRTAALVFLALALSACATSRPNLEPTGIGFGLKAVCVDADTGALYLMDSCAAPVK